MDNKTLAFMHATFACESCGEQSKGKDLLAGESPFDPSDHVFGCPHCLATETVSVVPGDARTNPVDALSQIRGVIQRTNPEKTDLLAWTIIGIVDHALGVNNFNNKKEAI